MQKNSSITSASLQSLPQKKHSESIKVALDDPLQKKCQICQKGFMLRRKLTCPLCLNVFCSDHCTKKHLLASTNEYAVLCDACNEEETKKEIINEINTEITLISKELENIKEGNDKLFKEHYNNTASLNNLEMEIKKQEWGARKQEEGLLGQLENEQSRGRSLRTTVDVLRKALDESSRNEKNLSDACIEADAENEILRVQLASLTEQNQELVNGIEKIQADLRGSLGIELLRKVLCGKCLAVVNENMNDGREIDIGPGDSVSVLSYSTDKPGRECFIC